ncbi:DUF6702 family protein [Luteithermobacter gelatinilyticus]|uniref:DUF6702 family protein n=1 Tax=Luteithermobacter gelatinilyticus TaxID=2582913 RepID=UPI001107127A|nr:DUF6702 family protein [Luteithermobacter gelatinilyticus]
MRRVFAAFCSLVMMVGVAEISGAHRFYAAFTQIDLHPERGVIQITHRLFTHDVEDLIRQRLDREKGPGAELLDQDIDDFLRQYIGGSFALYDETGVAVPLTWVGHEFNIDDIYVYQEAPLPDGLSRLGVIHKLFMDVFADQKNTVNIERAGEVQTRIFRKGDGVQFVAFPQD